MHGQVHSIFWGMLRHRAQVSGHHLQVHPTWAHWIMMPGCEIKEVAHPGKDQELKRGLMGSGAKAQGPSFQSGRPLRRGGNPSGLCVKPPCALPRHCARLGANWKGRSQSPGGQVARRGRACAPAPQTESMYHPKSALKPPTRALSFSNWV